MEDYEPWNQNKMIICQHCGSSYIPEKRGLHNWKKLFKKPSGNDWIVLILLIFTLIMTYAYMSETKTAREFASNFDAICLKRYSDLINISQSRPTYTIPQINLTIINDDDGNATATTIED